MTIDMMAEEWKSNRRVASPSNGLPWLDATEDRDLIRGSLNRIARLDVDTFQNFAMSLNTIQSIYIYIFQH